MRADRLALGYLAIIVISVWNYLISLATRRTRENRSSQNPWVTEHERGWRDYIRGFHAHHGDDGDPDKPPSEGSFEKGLELWIESGCLRGYTIGNHVYLCPWTPRKIRVHQAGHTPAFGEEFEPLEHDYREDGGLPDEPLRTRDVMLPGGFPHTFLRLTDERGLTETYMEWVGEGKIERVGE